MPILFGLAACNSGTSVLVHVTGPAPLQSLAADVTVAGANASREWMTPQLPASLVVRLADVSADVQITMSATTLGGEQLGQRGTVRSVPHQQVTLDIVLAGGNGDGGVGSDGGTDGGTDGGPDTTIALRSVQTGSVLNTSPLSIARPDGTQAGDILIATVYLGYGTAMSLPTITPSVSWTLVDRIDYSTTGSLLVYWREMTASDPASYSFASSGGGNTSGVGWVAAYTGVSTSNPIETHGGSSTNTSGTSCSTPSLVLPPGSSLLVAAFAGYINTSATATWTAPSGMTQIASLNNGDNRSGLGATLSRSSPGPTGALTATVSPSQTFCINHLLALSPP